MLGQESINKLQKEEEYVLEAGELWEENKGTSEERKNRQGGGDVIEYFKGLLNI